jgi:hypothetical protein
MITDAPQSKPSNPESARDQAPAVHATRTEIGMSQPLKIEMNSPTDWVTAVATPIAIAIAGVFFAWMNQRAQIRSSIATIRSEWLRELRTESIGYATAAIALSNACTTTSFFGSAAAIPYTEQVARHRAAIRLMLDPTKPYNQDMLAAMKGIADAIFAHDDTAFAKCLTEFIDSSRTVLESAWQDIRRDLKNGKKS